LPAGEGWGEGTVPECLDAETLTAYSEGQLAGSSAAGAEHHLLACATCTTEVQRLVQLRLAIGTVAGAAPAAETAANLRRRWLGLAIAIRDSARRFLTQPLPAFGALAASAMLLVVVTRFIPFGGSDEDVRYRGREARVEVEVIERRSRPRPPERRPGSYRNAAQRHDRRSAEGTRRLDADRVVGRAASLGGILRLEATSGAA
jgi:hypothetical protein